MNTFNDRRFKNWESALEIIDEMVMNVGLSEASAKRIIICSSRHENLSSPGHCFFQHLNTDTLHGYFRELDPRKFSSYRGIGPKTVNDFKRYQEWLKRQPVKDTEKKEENEMANKRPKMIFLSLPMSGRTDAEIEHQIEEMEIAAREINPFYEKCVSNFGCTVTDMMLREVQTPALLYLGKAIKVMSAVDAVMMGEGWEHARGCKIELHIARAYGIPVYGPDGRPFGEFEILSKTFFKE